MCQVVTYVTPSGKDVYRDWREHLRDRTVQKAIDRRLLRLEAGKFGDHKFCRDGIWELRFDLGPGYRIYYALSGRQIVVLLCAGDERTQRADIERAAQHWHQLQGGER